MTGFTKKKQRAFIVRGQNENSVEVYDRKLKIRGYLNTESRFFISLIECFFVLNHDRGVRV